ncbi:TIGR04338 family metallohydrolase [Antrihabitans sp. YC2-6]|uniref:TIGR04338 family metallohydrolase n=1 Tax=Antrihabitans sp. YC2-6 TaxID=2799498 RepID=UPI0018F5CA08|nr:TIGR04338 family metallohydrolase [Antrihabitans sp. YC2-6]MBJ8347657.1 TIGR04338 family metallohydrolase [Antrihabitans sp. YC2-6]
MTAARDSQRSKVYDAEHLVRRVFERADESGTRNLELLGSHLTLPIERKFASVESVQTYVDRVLALNWVRAKWPRAAVPVHVRERQGMSAAHYEMLTSTIAVPIKRMEAAWALRELVVLHELAHHLEAAESGNAPHGPVFVSRFLELVTEIVGPEAGLVLRSTMADCGVRFN